MMSRIPQKNFIPILICFTLILKICISPMAMADQKEKVDPEDKPQVWLEPETEIDQQNNEDDRSWISRNKWWTALGIAIISGIAVIIGGSSGNQDGDGNQEGGSYVNNW